MNSLEELGVGYLLSPVVDDIDKLCSSLLDTFGTNGLSVRIFHRHTCMVYVRGYGGLPNMYAAYAERKELLSFTSGESLIRVLSTDSEWELSSGMSVPMAML